MTTPVDGETAELLRGKRVAFVGKLGGITRREAGHLVRRCGGILVEGRTSPVDMIVIGADELPLGEEHLFDEAHRRGAASGQIEVITETQLWEQLGLVEHNVRLYTPAMLAELLKVSVATIRRWHRRRLIVPVREVHRLPYFDFQEVATARQLAQLLAAGVSPAAIEKKLENIRRMVPDVERPLAQLSVIIEGKQLLLRQGEGLIEPGGQLRIDFEALEQRPESDRGDKPTVAIHDFPMLDRTMTPADMRALAAQYEDEGELEAAVEMLHASMAAGGPNAETCFQLAELLYRLEDVTAARERYYMAIELDEDYVEARANLGCVLAETGQTELAVAAFQGTLQYHNDYPDVHYHLARILDEMGRPSEAEAHWHRFVELAPDSPWSEEARARVAAPSRPFAGTTPSPT